MLLLAIAAAAITIPFLFNVPWDIKETFLIDRGAGS
jgi:hypothetical protein